MARINRAGLMLMTSDDKLMKRSFDPENNPQVRLFSGWHGRMSPDLNVLMLS
jgi:hypothetical protein